MTVIVFSLYCRAAVFQGPILEAQKKKVHLCFHMILACSLPVLCVPPQANSLYKARFGVFGSVTVVR